MTERMVVAAALGACVGGALGSYWGVVADRGWTGSLTGRSRCDSCGRQLTWPELIPIAGYLFLRGRCHACDARLPATLLVRELVAAVTCAVAAALVVLTATR